MAGVWYRLGTVALTQGSKRVTGAGTTWLDQATGPVVGNTFWGPDDKPYEVGLVISDTTLDLVETYTGPTVSSAAYKINTTDKFSVAALAGQVAATLQYAQSQYANMSTWAAGDMPGDVPVILPNGIDTKLIPNLVSMVEATEGKLTETDQLKALDVPSSVFGRARLADANAAAQLTALGASAFGQARLADANAAAQLTALGASAFGQARLADADAAAQLTALGASPFGRARLGDANAAAARQGLDVPQFGRGKFQGTTAGLDWNSFGGFGDSGNSKDQFLVLGIDDGNGAGPSSPGAHFGAGLVFNAGYFAAQIAISSWGQIFTRTSYNGAAEQWVSVRTTATTTVDANGFIKSASPVIHLYPDGSFKAETADGVSVARVARGVYRVAGSLGFHPEGWYIEGPKDANGRMKFWLDYDQEPDGAINIRTTHREFTDGPLAQRNIVDGLSDGDPVDIPAGREITLRLSIPDDSKRFPDDRL